MQWFGSSAIPVLWKKKNLIEAVSSLLLNIGLQKIKFAQEALVHTPAGTHGSVLQFALSILRHEQYSL